MANAPIQTIRERVKFDNPPINELVISLFHIPILDLKAQHIGIFWGRIRERYPVCDQQSIVVSPFDPQLMEAPGELFPLPRFWFHNNKDQILIQVQRNAFMVNWRRLPDAPGEYPHYETVVQRFWQELEGYKTFLQETIEAKIDPIQRCELNYVNVISQNEFFTKSPEIVNVLPLLRGLADIQTGDRELARLSAITTYVVSSSISIDFAVRLGHRPDTNELAIGLELKAHGVPSDLSLEGARTWYDSAHDATYKLFLDATSAEMQEKVWKPR
jgi:uncharacterized protein (TIGR04255 family)